MAVGGALRAAIRAGRFGVAGRESRRQARALASLNQGGPLGSRTGSPFPFPGPERGFDPARVAGQAFGASPRGAAVVVDSNTGRRVVLPQSFDDFMEGVPIGRGEIESPLEGFRVFPGGRMNQLPGFGETMSVGAMPGATVRSMYPGTPFTVGAPPMWMGRGAGPTPSTGRFFPRDMSYGGGRMYNEEMGALQGQQFFAPSVPISGNPSGYNTDIFEQLYRAGLA